jgi:hypothetical protein
MIVYQATGFRHRVSARKFHAKHRDRAPHPHTGYLRDCEIDCGYRDQTSRMCLKPVALNRQVSGIVGKVGSGEGIPPGEEPATLLG